MFSIYVNASDFQEPAAGWSLVPPSISAGEGGVPAPPARPAVPPLPL